MEEDSTNRTMIPNREPRIASCRFEQAAYGSFPFREGGYGPLAHSPGCRAETLDSFHAACRAFGQPPPGSGDLAGTMLAMPIGRRGPWMIVGVHSLGSDDRGRPDALAFHGLFVERREFRKVGFDPFALAPALRRDWTADASLDAGSIPAFPIERPTEPSERARRIVRALERRRKVAFAADAPIAALASEVVAMLAPARRRRLSLATWAFSNALDLDLAAAPNLAGWELGGSRVDPFAEPPKRPRRPTRRAAIVAAWVVAGWVVAAALLGLAAWGIAGRDAAPLPRTIVPDEPREEAIRHAFDRSPAPDPASYADREEGADETAKVRDRLLALARAARVANPKSSGTAEVRDEATALMRDLHTWRYHGPLLTLRNLEEIAKSMDEGRSRALAWDRRIRGFAADRPLPRGFGTGPLRWQIDTLAWSFHQEPDPILTPSEAVDALADALKLDEPIRPNPLAAKYGTLRAYAKFLGSLPLR